MDLTGIGSLFNFGSKLVDKLFPDPEKAQEAKIELFKLQQNGELALLASQTDLAKGQLAVNVEEAKNSNFFVSGWRPSVGWVCSAAFAAKYLIGPLVFVVAQAINHPIVLPVIDMTEMLPILIGMLGLGAYRSYDKKNGTA